MSALDHSLLSFLDAPVVVGDPDGHAVYVNPAFDSRFASPGQTVLGRPLAELFQGGAREAVLRAVAEVCRGGTTARFQVREQGVGYAAVASPIMAQDEGVGVVILLQPEVAGAERLRALHRELMEPLESAASALDNLLEATGGRRAAAHREMVEEGLRGLSRMRKGLDEIAALLGGTPTSAPERFDPAELVRDATKRAKSRSRGGSAEILLLAPATLPRAPGDRDRLESLVAQLVELRLKQHPLPTTVAVGARRVEAAAGPATLIAVTETWADVAPPRLHPALGDLGGDLANAGVEVHVACEPGVGRATLLRLPDAKD